MTQKNDFQDCFAYPLEKGCAVFARPRGEGILVLMGKYNAMSLLKKMILHTKEILRVSHCFFEGRSLRLKILKA